MIYEYKVEEAKNSKAAEVIMNEYAKKGWRVHQVTYWINFKAGLVITFEKEVK